MVVVGTGGARGGASLIAELRTHRLQRAAGQGVVSRKCLCSGHCGSDGSDQDPCWAACVGGIVQVEMVGSERAIGPDRCTDRYGFPGGEGAAVGGGNGEPVVGLVGVERSRSAIGAGAIDGVGLIGLGTAGESVAA